MPDSEKTFRIFISSAEPSADAHCAGLINALKASGPNIEFVGVGGPKMAAAGCELLEITGARASMLFNALNHVAHYYKLLRRIAAYFKSNEVDLVIVCDSPAFNFHVAKAAKKARIKTLFYVAPQLWAWGAWRIGKLRKCCDKLCCILPMEQQWFAERGLDAAFVGNPLFDELDADCIRPKTYADFNPKAPMVALMPGSRTVEIDTLWQPMQQIALDIKRRHPDAALTTVAVNAERLRTLKQRQLPGFDCNYTTDSVIETARKADLAVVASGSATLQVAAAACPMVIMYQSNRILWYILGIWLIKTEFLSLVNIVAGRELVPEFMPHFSSIDPIIESVEQFLENRDKLVEVSSELAKLVEPLSRDSASKNVAKIVVELLTGQKSNNPPPSCLQSKQVLSY